MSYLGKSILQGFFWVTGGQTFITLITLLTNIILARILGPTEFGIIGIILFFTTLANVFVAGGLAGAIIRLPKTVESDFKTVFTFNLIVSFLFYLILYFSANYIANFYQEPRIRKILVVSGLVLFFNAFQLINNAKLVREMRFKQRSIYQTFATLFSSILAIMLARFGFGIWSLVFLQLSVQFLVVVQLAIFEPFFAKIGWDKKSFNKIYAFGINTTAANLINTAFQNIYQLVIGKYFSIAQVGFFYQAQKLEKVPNNILNYFVQNVLFSALSKLQNNMVVFNKTYNKLIQTLTVILGFVTIMTYMYGEEIIILLYGMKWIESAIYLQILIIASFFFMLEQFNRIIFKIFDKTKQILILEIFKKTIQSFTIYIGIANRDLEILILGLVFANIIGFIVNFIFSRKITKDYTEIYTVIKVVFTGIISIICVKVAVTLLNLKDLNALLTIPILFLIYFSLLHLFNVFKIKKDISTIYQLLKL